VPAIVALLADDPLGRRAKSLGRPAARSLLAGLSTTSPRKAAISAGRGAGRRGHRLPAADDHPRPVAPRHEARLIEAVRVSAACRGLGVGERLVRHAIEIARAAGCGLVQLTTDKSRADAHRFYERLGFVASHVGMKLALD
jgi:GNAT superfamily N-acetyltransferase